MKKCLVLFLGVYLICSSLFGQDLSKSQDYLKVINQLLLIHNSFSRIQCAYESQAKDLLKIKNDELVKIKSSMDKSKIILSRLVIQFPKDSIISEIKQNVNVYNKCIESFSTSAWQERPMWMMMDALVFERLEIYSAKF